ncbi:four helix bundle protein [Maribellus sediminis]|uniref:four helix bundle protein n=1 Tax=Maribellus sediminis TaxID=2696285 RepID=UPI00143118C1|nr:four helix bundle protein [Maribellus sediminis]
MKNYPHSTFFDFESLELYKKSLDYTDFVYDLVMLFPKEERFELGSQLNRAATSISLNIAEGYGESIPLAIRYLRIVRGSIRECLACSTIAFRRNYMDEQKYVESRAYLVELSKLAAGYKKYLNRKLNK